MNTSRVTRCAIWARVSTTDQHTANQTGVLREWAARRGLDIAAEYITEDSGWASGNGAKGKQFDAARTALLDGARLGTYEVILVWAIDRLSRRGIEDTLAALRRLSDAGCVVWSHQEPWAEDLRDPRMRELFLAIAAWMAEMESGRRSERIKAGLARRRASGLPVGGRKTGAKDKRKRDSTAYAAEQARRVAARRDGQ
jgi:putative DNA-invertase from lambdoid prophage Rac